MRRALAFGLMAACAFVAPDARATAAVLFPKGDARVERHTITVAFTATGTVAWDTIDVGGSVNDIGLVVAVKAGGRVELTEPGWVAAVDVATRVVIRTLPPGVACAPVTVGGGVDFDGGFSSSSGGRGSSSGGSSGGGCGGGGGSGSGQSESSSGGGCGCGSDKSTSNQGEASGGCLTSSKGGCGSCDDNGCEPSDNGHPGCSAIHGCAPANNIGESPRPRDNDSGAPMVGPYEVTRIRAADGSASDWIARNGYQAPAGFIDGLLALEAAGYEVQAFRARSPESPQIVRSLRVVTTSPGAALPLRLVRMSTRADAAPTPVTVIALASGGQALVGQTLVAIDENKLSSSNYETLVTAALGARTGDAGADGGVSMDTRWLAESSRTLVTKTTPEALLDAAPTPLTLGDLFRQECGEKKSEPHLVCSDDAAGDADGGGDAGATADAGSSDSGSSDSGSSDAGRSDAGSADGGEVDASCTSVARQRCDDLSLAFPGTTNSATASRFRGLVGGTAALVGDLAFVASTAPVREGRYTVRANGEAGLCLAVGELGIGDGTGSGDLSGEASTACKTVRRGRRVDLGPLVMLLVVVRALAFIMRRKRPVASVNRPRR